MNSSKYISTTLIAAIFLTISCSREPELKPPNILFCIADDVSFPHMGAYGCDWIRSPSFDRIAQQGLLFTNAYTLNAKCSPSRNDTTSTMIRCVWEPG